MRKKLKFSIWYVVFAIWGVLLLQNVISQIWTVEEIPFSQFLEQVDRGDIAEVVVGKDVITGKYKPEADSKYSDFVTVKVDPDLLNAIRAKNIPVRGVIESTLLKDVVSWVLPVLVFFGIWYLIMRKMADQNGLGGSFLSLGKSKVKVYMEAETKVTFADVAGIDEVEDELKEIVQFLKDPDKYGRLGGRLPRGILLVGPPGTGKTLLARAVAGEAKVPYFSINGSEFVEMFVGLGAARVRDLFDQARKHAPCIIFIDELDALGKARGNVAVGGHDEKEQTLNQLLVELDGFEASTGIVLLAATNRPEILDPALLRAGRFDRQILVDKPDKKGREHILAVHLKKIKYDSTVSPEAIAGLTIGLTGADLSNLVNEAALLATRRGAELVGMWDFTAAIERLVAGLEKKSRVLSDKERRVVAYHEMGHVLTSLSIPTADPIMKVSIIPRGIGALGYMMQRPLEDRYLVSRDELIGKMVVLLGGRASESIVFGDVSTGAANDLSRVTEIARFMVTRYGMSEKLGLTTYEDEPAPLLGKQGGVAVRGAYSEETARLIDEEIRRIVQDASERARDILSKKRPALDLLAAELLERETLSLEEIERIIERTQLSTAA